MGGRLIAPVGGKDRQNLTLIQKIGKDKYETKILDQVLFVPLLEGKIE